MSSGGDFDVPAPAPVSRQPPRRSLLPWFLIAAGVAMGLLLIVGGAAVFYLSQRAKTPAEAVPSDGSPPRVARASAAECETLGRTLEQAVNSGDAAAIGRLFDWHTMVRRAAHGLEMPTADLESFAAGVSQGASKVATERLVALGRDGGRFDYLRTIERDGHRRAFCRIITPEGTVDFLEYLPIGQDDSLRVGDAFSYSTGEDVSASLRRILLPLVAHQNRTLLERLTGSESDLIRHGDDFSRLISTNLQGDWQETLDIYSRLPHSLQRERYVLLTVLHAASFADEQRYVELVDLFRSEYPDDAAIDLLVVNYHYLRGELDLAIAALRRLDERVEGDAFLQSMIADMLIEQKKFAAADAMLRKAVRSEPDLSWPYIGLVGSAVAAGDSDEAVARLDELEQVILGRAGDGLDQAGLRESLAIYAGSETFFASPEFREWESIR